MSPKVATLCFLLVIISTISLSQADTEDKSVYDLLKEYGLPSGILPKGIGQNDFTFNRVSGQLVVRLPFLKDNNQVCKVNRTAYFQNIPVVYNLVELQPSIRAVLVPQKLVDVEGVTATIKIFNFVVLENEKIIEARVSNNKLQFISERARSPEFEITKDFDIPQDCVIAPTYSAI